MTLRTRLIGLAATLSLVALLAGVPVALIAMDATPIPEALPTWEQIRVALMTPDDGTLLLTIIEVLAWGAWAVTAGSVLLEIGARLRGLRAPHLPGLRAPQLAAHQLIAAAALLFIAVPSSATPAVASPGVVAVGLHTPDHTATAYETRIHRGVQAQVLERSNAVNAPTSTSGQAAQSAADTEVVSEGGRTYVVQRGDYLALIADRELGDASRWPELVTANPALADNPDLIYSGTTLTIPTTQQNGAAGGDAGVFTYVVRAGDTLSGIAETFLGDGNRYPEIFTASRRTLQPGGIYLTHPDQIDIGQTITIPTTSSSPNGYAGTPGGQDTAPVRPDYDGTSETTDLNGAAPRPDGGQGQDMNVPPSAVPDEERRSGAGTNVSPSSSATATASPVPVPSSAGAHAVDPETGTPVSEGMTVAPWMLAGLTGAGALLAGGLLLRLRKAQAMRVRYRRPGRTLTNPPATLHPVEMTMHTIGEITAPTVEHLDSLLRRLAAARAAVGEPMPQLAAVKLTPTTIVLHLTGAIELPKPWSSTDDNLHWTLPATHPLDAVGPEAPDKPAPYPLLVTIGVDDHEHTWLLNLENNPITLTGDTTFAYDLIRHIALEASVGPWSRSFAVTALGIAAEIAGPERITTHPGTDDTDAIAEHLVHAKTMIGYAADAGTDVYTARAHEIGDDWPARLLILTEDHAATPLLGELFTLIEDNPGGTGVILQSGQPTGVGMTLHVTDNGRLRLVEADLDLIPVGLTADEAEGCAAVLALAETSDDAPVPVDEEVTTGWPSWSDQAGAIRHEHTRPRHPEGDTGTQGLNGHRRPTIEQPETPVTTTPADDESPEPGARVAASSLLPEPDDTYTTAAATTAQDLQTLAPAVPAEVAKQVIDTDPTLDDDLAMWFHPNCALPRLHLLGPVHATTRGKPLIKRKPYMTELLTFLALRRHGATRDEIAEAFNITTERVREPVSTVREWLGTNPRTGQPHIPDARYSPSASVRGAPAYQVIDLLIDADLFRRLRLRAQARGEEGLDDLTAALSLVQGRPFDYPRSRESGGRWTWLINGEHHDQHLTVAIVDVAHIVTTHALAQGDLATARQAAETARLAAPDEETPRLDLAAVAAAEGHQNEARRILREDIYNRTDDDLPPPDVPTRTDAILQEQTWLQPRQTEDAGSPDRTGTPAAHTSTGP